MKTTRHLHQYFLLTLFVLLITLGLAMPPARAQILNGQKLLEKETFWDNKDWDWYKKTIPFFECPDKDITTTYYYRWELVTKHLTYGSPETGYTFTEFIDRPFWSGRYGAISCPSGLQLSEVRWLREPRYARDYARYWFRTEGAQPRRYSCWLADSVWAVHLVHPDRDFSLDLLPDLMKNYQGWEISHFVAEVGLFWQIGHDDGMETNINSRQTRDSFRGAPGYRPTFNSYMIADALAIARLADIKGNKNVAGEYRNKAKSLKTNMQKKLWDQGRDFFLQMYKQDEEKDGQKIKALTLTYQSGKYAGSKHGREEIGFVPWQFNIPDAGFESAWKFLMDRNYFFSDYGPTTVERHDPLFLISKNCCVWSGQSWPYATTQTLVALANLLNNYDQKFVNRNDYFKLFKVYTLTQRKNGKPYIAEAANPDTGSWEGHDSYNHSEHYFHSAYNDLLITGLVGLRPRADDILEVNPLVPADWDYFALDEVPYHGHKLAIVWDRTGQRYGLGKGFHLVADGKKIFSSQKLELAKVELPSPPKLKKKSALRMNYAVNNDGRYYPKVSASFTNPKTPLFKVNDGNYWYTLDPPNRWTCAGSKNPSDWVEIDFGIVRPLDTVKLYVLADGDKITAPAKIELQSWNGKKWQKIPDQVATPEQPTGHRANIVRFPTLLTAKVRAILHHQAGSRSGLTEFEAWGDGTLPLKMAGPPAGNLAANVDGKGFPKVSASFTSRFDNVAQVNDGLSFFSPTPHNRWTSYESPNATDWLQIDFGEKKKIGRVELHIFDDRGGVQAPFQYEIQYWDGSSWEAVANPRKTPLLPAGGRINTVRFTPVSTSKIRVVFTHKGKSRSGLTEIEVWEE